MKTKNEKCANGSSPLTGSGCIRVGKREFLSVEEIRGLTERAFPQCGETSEKDKKIGEEAVDDCDQQVCPDPAT